MSKKSLLLGVIFSILMVPQITLAAWWNPISWFNNWHFSKSTEDVKTQVLENRIEELEKKLENKASGISTTTEITATTTQVLPSPKKVDSGQVPAPTQPPKKPVVVPKQAPSQAVQPVNPVRSVPLPLVQPARDYKALYDDLQAKYAFMRDKKVDSDIVSTREASIQDSNQQSHLKYLNDLYFKLDGLLAKVGKRVPSEFDSWELTYNQIIKEYTDENNRYVAGLTASSVANQNATNDAVIKATLDKQEKLNAVNQKIADLNAKYAKDIAAARNSSGMTLEQSDAVVRNLNSQYIINYDALQAEYQQILYSR